VNLRVFPEMEFYIGSQHENFSKNTLWGGTTKEILHVTAISYLSWNFSARESVTLLKSVYSPAETICFLDLRKYRFLFLH